MVQEVKASGLPVLFDDSPVAGKSTDTDAPGQELIDPKESIHAVQVMHDPLVEPFYWIFWWMLEVNWCIFRIIAVLISFSTVPLP